jgi:hypothetical protein
MWLSLTHVEPQAILPYTVLPTYIQHRHKIVARIFFAFPYLPRMPQNGTNAGLKYCHRILPISARRIIGAA